MPDDANAIRITAMQADNRVLVEFAVELARIPIEPPMAGFKVEAPPNLVPASAVLMFQFGRAFRSFQAVGLLTSRGYTQDAMVIVRTLIEVMFEMAFVAKFPDDAPKFLEHGQALERDLQRRLTKDAPDFMKSAIVTMFDDEGSPDDFSSAKRKLSSGWHPVHTSVRARALAAGLQPFWYDLVYTMASRYVHGSGDWLRETVRSGSDGVHISYNSDVLERNLVLMMACDAFMEVLTICAGCLEVPINDQLAALRKRHATFCESRAATLPLKYRASGEKQPGPNSASG